MADDEILDLDAVAPPTRKFKLDGKIIECKPLKLKNLIKVIKLQERLSTVKTADEVYPLIQDALGASIKEVNDPDFDLALSQLKLLVDFVQKVSQPSLESSAREFEDPKKKQNSVEGSPTS